MYYLGIDLGGTNIAAAIVTDKGSIISKVSTETGKELFAESIVSKIANLCLDAAKQASVSFDQIAAVGVGVPGIANPETGIVEYSCNLNFHDEPFAAMLYDRLRKPVYLENDANAAALGEYAAGAGRGCGSLVAITLGTGVGGGIVINDRLYSGFNHAGAEIGHFVLQHGGQPCSCGRRGCFEAYASATALIRMTKEKMTSCHDSMMWEISGELNRVNGQTAFIGSKQGDKAAAEVVEKYTEYLACGITSIVNIFQPEVVCIGGGISHEGETLLKPIRTILNKEDYARNSKNRTKLICATLGNDAGLIGAALLPCFAGL